MNEAYRPNAKETNKCGRRLAADVATEFDSAVTIEGILVRGSRAHTIAPWSHWSFPPTLPMAARRIGDLLFSNRRGSRRGLVDTIVNTGGNSCKKFKPPGRARSRIIFVAVPSPSLPPSKSPRFVLQLTANIVLRPSGLVWIIVSNFFSAPRAYSFLTQQQLLGEYYWNTLHALFMYICVRLSVRFAELNGRARAELHFFIEHM